MENRFQAMLSKLPVAIQSSDSSAFHSKIRVSRETDAEVRATDVFVLQNPLSDAIVRKCLPDLKAQVPQIQHWSILAIFHPPPGAEEHEVEIRMYELAPRAPNPAEEGELGQVKIIEFFYSKVELGGLESLMKREKYTVLCEEPYRIEASPLQFKEAGDQNTMNGKPYDSTFYNCQHWVKEVLLKFGLVLPVLDLSQAGGWAFIAGLVVVQQGLNALAKVEKLKQKKKVTNECNKNTIHCKYHAQGFCRRGTDCAYKH